MKRLLFDKISAMRMKSCIMCFWGCHFIFAYMDLILPPSFSLFLNLSLSFPFPFLHAFSYLITPQLLPKHCAETISAARYRKQKKPMPKKGEVQKEKPGAESLRKDRTVANKSVFFLFPPIISISFSTIWFVSTLSEPADGLSMSKWV